MAFKMKGGLEGPMRKNFGDQYSPMNKKIDPPTTRQDTVNAVIFQDPRNQDFIFSNAMPYDLREKLETSNKKVGKLDQETIDKINKEEESKINQSPMTKNGTQDKKVPSIPTKEGSDTWRAKFLKDHGITNKQVNDEIYRISVESGVPGEDDVDLADWKNVVINLSKKKSTK